MSDFRFEHANTLTAFDNKGVIGTKVLKLSPFMKTVATALRSHDKSKDKAKGQHFITLPKTAHKSVSAGIGRKSDNPNDYVVRVYRCQPSLFLRRFLAAEVEGLACVVYTKEAYLDDPDVIKDEGEYKRIEDSDCTHVIIAILAFAGPKAPLTPYRLVHNLSGGNNEVDSWTMDDVREKARESLNYWNNWWVVAD